MAEVLRIDNAKADAEQCEDGRVDDHNVKKLGITIETYILRL